MDQSGCVGGIKSRIVLRRGVRGENDEGEGVG